MLMVMVHPTTMGNAISELRNDSFVLKTAPRNTTNRNAATAPDRMGEKSQERTMDATPLKKGKSRSTSLPQFTEEEPRAAT
jgi:hypothetical protein